MLTLSKIIPDLIKVMCINYFRDDEIFHNICQRDTRIVLSSNKKILSRQFHPSNANLNLDQHNNNHGINKIYSDQQIKIQWDLLILPQGKNGNGDMLIGIANKDDHVDEYIDDGDTIFYLFKYHKIWLNHGVSRFFHRDNDDEHSISDKYGSDYYQDQSISNDDGDRVSVYLDLEERKIKLIVNGVDFEFASTSIRTSSKIQYKLCVIFDDESSVEILDFKKMY